MLSISQATEYLLKILKKKKRNPHKSNVIIFVFQSSFKGVSQNITLQSAA